MRRQTRPSRLKRHGTSLVSDGPLLDVVSSRSPQDSATHSRNANVTYNPPPEYHNHVDNSGSRVKKRLAPVMARLRPRRRFLSGALQHDFAGKGTERHVIPPPPPRPPWTLRCHARATMAHLSQPARPPSRPSTACLLVTPSTPARNTPSKSTQGGHIHAATGAFLPSPSAPSRIRPSRERCLRRRHPREASIDEIASTAQKRQRKRTIN